MARGPRFGNPGSDSHRYVIPRPAFALATRGAIAIAGVLGLLLLFQVIGVQGPLMPGSVIREHAGFRGCEECHVKDPLQGTSNFRCQRCHDPAGVGRLTQAAHVTQALALGRTDTAPAPDNVACAQCHIEHRGPSGLSDVKEDQCLRCHAVRFPTERSPKPFRDFSKHPEFQIVAAVLAQKAGAAAVETPGISFTHANHLGYVLEEEDLKKTVRRLDDYCALCHQIDRGNARAARTSSDFKPVEFTKHCTTLCHNHVEKDLKVKDGVCKEAGLKPLFQCEAGGALGKDAVEHKDRRVMDESSRLLAVLDPAGNDREIARVRSRIRDLERRALLATPLAGLDEKALAAISARLKAEIAALDERTKGPAPELANARIEEVARAADKAGEAARAATLRDKAKGIAAAADLDDDAFERRRNELSELLAAIDAAAEATIAERTAAGPEAAAKDPVLKAALARKAVAADLRLRLLGARRGRDQVAADARARAQREEALERVLDEVALRRTLPAQPVPSRRAADEQAALQADLRATRAQLAILLQAAKNAGVGADAAKAKAAAAEAFDALVGKPAAGEGKKGQRCLKCHEVEAGDAPQGRLLPARAARPVLVLSRFLHLKHVDQPITAPQGWWKRLTSAASKAGAVPVAMPSPDLEVPMRNEATTCLPCHVSLLPGGAPGKPVQWSNDARDLHIPPVQVCQSCHDGSFQRQDCGLCHLYHPPGR